MGRASFICLGISNLAVSDDFVLGVGPRLTPEADVIDHHGVFGHHEHTINI